MIIKQHPTSKLWVREDGAVCVPPDRIRFKKFRWTFGCENGDIVNDGDVVNIVKTKEGYEIELWRNFELVNSDEIYYCPKCGRKLSEAK